MTFIDVLYAVILGNLIFSVLNYFLQDAFFSWQRAKTFEVTQKILRDTLEVRAKIMETMKSEPVKDEVDSIK